MNLHEIYLAAQLAKNDINNINVNLSETKTDIAKTSEQAALNRSTLGYQRKNFLLNNCASVTKNGVTATVNSDKSITLTGSNSSGNAFVLYVNIQTGASGNSAEQYVKNKKWIPSGKYIVSGGVSACVVQVCVSSDNTSSTTNVIAQSSSGDAAVTITDDNKYVWSRILISTSADFTTPVTIYPMIRLADIADAAYETYKPSVEERLAALEEKLAALEAK